MRMTLINTLVLQKETQSSGGLSFKEIVQAGHNVTQVLRMQRQEDS